MQMNVRRFAALGRTWVEWISW